MSEEQIKLSLDYGTSAKDTVDISGKLDMLKNAATSVGGEAFGELVSKSIEVGKAFAGISFAADKAEKDTKFSFGELKEHGKSLFDAFSGQNAGGMIKSIAGIAGLVPALAPFAAGITAAGEAAATAWPIIKEWYEYIDKANTAMVESVKGIDKYVSKLKEANHDLKETDALKKLREEDEAETPDVKKKERGEIFASLTKGRGESSLKEITEALDPEASKRDEQIDEIKKKLDARLKEIDQRGVTQPEPVNQAFRRQAHQQARDALAKIGDGAEAQSKAEKLLERAKSGDAGALEELMKLLPEGSTTREIARMASPQAKEEQAESRRYAAEQERQSKEQGEFERSRPEIGEQQRAAQQAHDRETDRESLKAGGFESLPELSEPHEAPRPLPGAHDEDMSKNVRPVQQLQTNMLSVMGKFADDMAQLTELQKQTLQKIEMKQQTTGASIQGARTQQNQGTW